MTVDIFIHQFIFWNVIVKQATDVWVLNKTIHIDDTESVLTGIIAIDDQEALQNFILAEKICWLILYLSYLEPHSLPK